MKAPLYSGWVVLTYFDDEPQFYRSTISTKKKDAVAIFNDPNGCGFTGINDYQHLRRRGLARAVKVKLVVDEPRNA